jgi:hypothetical protein
MRCDVRDDDTQAHSPPPPGTAGLGGKVGKVGDTVGDTDDTVGDTGLTAIVGWQLTPRQRRSRVVVIAGCILLLFVVIVGSTANVWGRAASALQHLATSPSATASLAPGPDLLYVDADVPNTSVTVDGAPVPTPTPEVAPPLRLSPGHHVIGWQSALFSAQECSLSVPPAAHGDTCAAHIEGELTLPGQPPVPVLHTGESISTVKPDQQQPLIDAISSAISALDSTTTVHPGELYLANSSRVQASDAVTAILSYKFTVEPYDARRIVCEPSLDLSSTFCTPSPTTCTSLCTVPWTVRPASHVPPGSSNWYVFGVIHPSWTFYGSDIATDIATDQPLTQDGGVDLQLALLRISFDATTQAWRVSTYLDTPGMPLRLSMGQLVGTNSTCVALHGLLPSASHAGTTIRYIPAPNPADGCVADVNGPGGSPAAVFIYRFGIVLAANDQAHALGPNLPIAGTYAWQLAQQISVLPGGWTA